MKKLALALLLALLIPTAGHALDWPESGGSSSGGSGGAPGDGTVDLDSLDSSEVYTTPGSEEVVPVGSTTTKKFRYLSPVTTFYFEQSREAPRFVYNSTTNAFAVDAATNTAYGLAKFDNATDKGANCLYFPMPAVRDYNTGVDLRLDEFRVLNGASDANDQVYEVAVASKVAGQTWASATYGSGVTVTLVSGLGTAAKEERSYATADTLTGWKSVVASGVPWCVRVCRDGDAAGDSSSVDSYFSMLTIRAANTIP